MPLFLRALPLSLLTLWHYVFVLPLVMVVAIPFSLLTLIPILGLPVIMAIATFITFAGYRCALAAHGKGNQPSFGKLVRSSFSWGFINTLASIVLLIIGLGIGTLLGGINLPSGFTVPGMVALPYATEIGALIYVVLALLYTCAAAVPMTDAAHAATPKNGDPVPFFGFGAGLFSLMIALVLWSVGYVLLGFLDVILTAASQGLALATAKVMEIPIEEPVEFDWVAIAIALAYTLWGTCWFCATAVLAWDRKIRHRDEVATEISRSPRISAEDLRALRESRMQGNSEQV